MSLRADNRNSDIAFSYVHVVVDRASGDAATKVAGAVL